ncbi:copper amine oxidase N-terminal domain-containing protein [Brevibacillus sp. GCM10020057]|uniref:copper amine oxidase N-terminal domain-containing protein n=1 Tax=Brevibacillus sp. GCM10020057 TaxID=3317327 RepID=UPI0036259959
MEKSKKALPIVLASALAATPLVVVPQQASALSSVTVTADDETAGEDSEYTIEFTTGKDLDEGDTITIKFDSAYDVDDSIDDSDVEIDGYDIDDVEVDGNEIIITLDEPIDKGEDLEITISDGITNPDDEDTYEVGVKTSSENTFKYDEVDIQEDDSSSSDEFDVSLSSQVAGEKVSIELGDFDLDGKDKLEAGKTITVIFPDEDMLPSSIDESDVKVNGNTAKSVDVDGDEVTIKVPNGADGDDYLDLEFLKSAGITNPEKADDYTFKVKYDGTTYESESFDITKSSSSTSTVNGDYTVNLSDPTAGARSSYTFETDFGNKKLQADSDLIIEFPSAEMVPMILSPSDFTVNGKTPKKVGALGNKVYITTPSNFSADSNVKVVVAYTAWITNPKTAGSYTLKATVDGKTITSKAFSIGGGTVTPTTPTTPAPSTPTPGQVVNNSTATITLTNTALGQTTGVNVAIKGLGVGLAKQRDFIELVFPAGYKVPAYIAPTSISVNGVAANYVAVRGQNVLVYPSQDIPAATAANVAIAATANIVNPTVKNAYSISVYTSEEKGLQFARAVGVGMPAPAQPATPAPVQPTTPAQPSAAVPANAALFKVNAKSFTLHGKSYPLQVAPYLAGGNTTMVPAQFFKEALALTTQWNNQSVAIISGTKVLKFSVGSNKARIGSQEVTLPAPVVLKEGMPMIPVRFVTDNLGYKVGWDAKTSSVYVYR